MLRMSTCCQRAIIWLVPKDRSLTGVVLLSHALLRASCDQLRQAPFTLAGASRLWEGIRLDPPLRVHPFHGHPSSVFVLRNIPELTSVALPALLDPSSNTRRYQSYNTLPVVGRMESWGSYLSHLRAPLGLASLMSDDNEARHVHPHRQCIVYAH